MKKIMVVSIILFSFIYPDVIYLKDGRNLKGEITKSDTAYVEIVDEKGIKTIIPKGQIEKILKEPSSSVYRDKIWEVRENLRRYKKINFWGNILSSLGICFVWDWVNNKKIESLVYGVTFSLGGIIVEMYSEDFFRKAEKGLDDLYEGAK